MQRRWKKPRLTPRRRSTVARRPAATSRRCARVKLASTALTRRAKRYTSSQQIAKRVSPTPKSYCAISTAPPSPRADGFLRRPGALTLLLQVRLVYLHVGFRLQAGDIRGGELAAHLFANAVAESAQPCRVRRGWRDDALD